MTCIALVIIQKVFYSKINRGQGQCGNGLSDIKVMVPTIVKLLKGRVEQAYCTGCTTIALTTNGTQLQQCNVVKVTYTCGVKIMRTRPKMCVYLHLIIL